MALAVVELEFCAEAVPLEVGCAERGESQSVPLPDEAMLAEADAADKGARAGELELAILEGSASVG